MNRFSPRLTQPVRIDRLVENLQSISLFIIHIPLWSADAIACTRSIENELIEVHFVSGF